MCLKCQNSAFNAVISFIVISFTYESYGCIVNCAQHFSIASEAGIFIYKIYSDETVCLQ